MGSVLIKYPTIRFSHQTACPRHTPKHHRAQELCNGCIYWQQSRGFPLHLATTHLAWVPHLLQKEKSQNQKCMPVAHSGAKKIAQSTQALNNRQHILKMWLSASSRLISEQINIPPGLFFGAFWSKYWRRLWLPLHHTQRATGNPAEKRSEIKDNINSSMACHYRLENAFVRDWMNMRDKIHRN